MGVSVSAAALATLRRIRAAHLCSAHGSGHRVCTTECARWHAWKRAHPNVRASMRTHLLVDDSKGYVRIMERGVWALAGADASRRSERNR